MIANQDIPPDTLQKIGPWGRVGEDIKVGDGYKRRGKGENESGRTLIWSYDNLP